MHFNMHLGFALGVAMDWPFSIEPNPTGEFGLDNAWFMEFLALSVLRSAAYSFRVCISILIWESKRVFAKFWLILLNSPNMSNFHVFWSFFAICSKKSCDHGLPNHAPSFCYHDQGPCILQHAYVKLISILIIKTLLASNIWFKKK